MDFVSLDLQGMKIKFGLTLTEDTIVLVYKITFVFILHINIKRKKPNTSPSEHRCYPATNREKACTPTLQLQLAPFSKQTPYYQGSGTTESSTASPSTTHNKKRTDVLSQSQLVWSPCVTRHCINHAKQEEQKEAHI